MVIWGALCAAVAVFFAVSLILDVGGPDPRVVEPMLGVSAVMAVACVAGSRLWPPRIKQLPDVTPEQMALNRHIIGCALCEGATLFALVTFIVTHSTYALAIASFCFCALLALYPTLERWNRLLGQVDLQR